MTMVKRETSALLIGMKTCGTITEISMENSTELTLEIPCDSAIFILSIFHHELKTSHHKNTYLSMSTAAKFIRAASWKQPIYLIDNQIKKMWYLRAMEFHSAITEDKFETAVRKYNIKSI